MSKSKKRSGLQKDFSTIFDGVWIPPKPHQQQDQPEQADKDRDNAVPTPTHSEQEQAVETPTPDEKDRAVDIPAFNEPDQAIETPIADEQQYEGDAPAPDKQEQAEDTATIEGHRRKIKEIISSMKCPKGFVCYKSDFRNLCKVVNVGEGKIIECSPVNQGPCVYRFAFMDKIFCKCPLRYYIARNLNM